MTVIGPCYGRAGRAARPRPLAGGAAPAPAGIRASASAPSSEVRMCELCGGRGVARQPSRAARAGSAPPGRGRRPRSARRGAPSSARAPGRRRRARAAPGARSSRNVTSEETGCPAARRRASRRASRTRSGLPGAQRDPPKTSSTPSSRERRLTWSCAPTDMPPVMIADVGLERRRDRGADRRGVVAASVDRDATAPARSTSAGTRSAGVAHRARPQRPPAPTSSSPVVTTRRAGGGRRGAGSSPTDASTPSSAGPSRAPAREHRSPARTSLAGVADVVGVGARRATRARRSPVAARVSSTRTTASAPAGTPRRSRSRRPRPAPTRASAGLPARDSSTTRSRGARARRVGGPHREAVHRRVVERRHVAVGRARPRRARARAPRRADLREQRPRALEHPRARLLELDPATRLTRSAPRATARASDAILRTVSRNLVELVRRTHAVDAPTAIEVLKEAVEDHGEITDDDRRAAAGGLRAARGGRLRRLDLLRRPAGRRAGAATSASAPARRASPRPATRTSRSCATGSAWRSASAAPTARVARGDRLPRLLPLLARRPRRRRRRRRARGGRAGPRRREPRPARSRSGPACSRSRC